MNETPDWARALGLVPSGLFIVTAGSGDDATGFLASWVQQVGLEPPAVSVSVKQGRHAAKLIRLLGAFCVSVLDVDSKELLGHFARGFAAGDPAFVGIDTASTASGVPYLTGALGHLECRLIGDVDWSDHTVFCGEVVSGGTRGTGEPLVHVRKSGLTY